MSEKLRPCPFCGGKPEMIEAEEAGPNAMVICCRGCMASSKVIYALKDSVDDLLAEAWNARSIDDPLIEALEPFAFEAVQWEGYSDGEHLVEEWPNGPASSLTVGDLRRARAALSKAKGDA